MKIVSILLITFLSAYTAHADEYILQTKPLPQNTYETSIDYNFQQWRWGVENEQIPSIKGDTVDRKAETTLKVRAGLGNNLTLTLAGSYLSNIEQTHLLQKSERGSGFSNPTLLLAKSFGEPGRRIGYMVGAGVQGSNSSDYFYKDTSLIMDLGFSATDPAHATFYGNYRLNASLDDSGALAHLFEIGIKENLQVNRLEVFVVTQILPAKKATINFIDSTTVTQKTAPGTFNTQVDAGFGLRIHFHLAEGLYLTPRIKMFYPIKRNIDVNGYSDPIKQEPYLTYEAGAALIYNFSR